MNTILKDDQAGKGQRIVGRAGVRMMNRSSRLFEPVNLPFSFILGELVLKGRALAPQEFEVEHEGMAAASPRDPSAPSDASTNGWGPQANAADLLKPGALSEGKLRIELFGFVCEIEILAEALERLHLGNNTTVRFALREISSEGHETLRRIARSYRSGIVPSFEDLAQDVDAQTATRPSDASMPADPPRRLWRSLIGSGLAVAVIVGCVAFIGMSVYDRFLLIHSEFATVTAPEVKLISAEIGQVRTSTVAVGQLVARDEQLFRINSDDISAQREVLEARVAYLGDSLRAGQGAASRDLPQIVSFERRGPASVDDARRELSLAQGELRALALREAQLVGYAPCACMVNWYREDGAWVTPGDTVAVLARTDADALRIEALVHVGDADRLFVGQTANVTDIGSGVTIEGTVERITLDPHDQPRIGFPEWLRQQETLASVIVSVDGLLLPEQIGQPLAVSIRDSVLGRRPAAPEMPAQ